MAKLRGYSLRLIWPESMKQSPCAMAQIKYGQPDRETDDGADNTPPAKYGREIKTPLNVFPIYFNLICTYWVIFRIQIAKYFLNT